MRFCRLGGAVVALLVLATGAACRLAPSPLPEAARTLTVCEAVAQPAGGRVRVGGEFDGFKYGHESTEFLVVSDEVCTATGEGLVWVALWHPSERSKATSLQPRRPRERKPGDRVVVEGEIERGGDDRTIVLRRAIVRDPR